MKYTSEWFDLDRNKNKTPQTIPKGSDNEYIVMSEKEYYVGFSKPWK